MSQQAYAWIPSTDIIERKLDDQRRPRVDLRIELRSVVPAGEPATLMDVIATKDGRLMWRRHRLKDGQIDSHRWGEKKHASKARINEAPAWLQWFAGQKARAIFEAIKLDRQTSSLALLGKQVLWVAGATAQQPMRPQIHLERDSGTLRKIVELRGDAVFEVSLKGDMKSGTTQTRWPAFITFREGKTSMTYEVLRVLEGAPIDEQEFRSDGTSAREEPK